MFSEDQLLPLSALQHWLFCPRQCALIHLEQAWAENRFTAEGQVLHKKAHEGADENKAGVRITRGMAVRSNTLGISGQCGVVEFHAACGNFKSQISNLKSTAQAVVPVEYKRGKPKSHRADEVQLCAQAMCLEEMLGTEIPKGHLYYGEKRRRTEVAFDAALHQLTTETAAALHAMIASRETPSADYNPRRCDSCSLIEICQPKSMRYKRGAAAWFASKLKSQI